MPQNNVQADWQATYPRDLQYQKPSGVMGTVSKVPSAGAWAAGVVTLTVPAMTDTVGSQYQMNVSGMTPAGYNGSYMGTIASPTTITYAQPNTLAAATGFGTVTWNAIVPIGLSTTLWAHAVPNKPQWTGTQLAEAEAEAEAVPEEEVHEEEPQDEETQEEEPPEDEPPHPTHRR